VLPWEPGEACGAATTCFNAWLEARGGSGPGEIRDGIEQVRLFLERHGASRFQAWEATSNVVLNRAGFTRTDSDGDPVYYILPTVWKSEVCQGRDAKAIAAALVERGMLDPDPNGKAARSLTVPALGQSKRLYCVNSKIFEGENDG
jgi:putative DNA primase/helicase